MTRAGSGVGLAGDSQSALVLRDRARNESGDQTSQHDDLWHWRAMAEPLVESMNDQQIYLWLPFIESSLGRAPKRFHRLQFLLRRTNIWSRRLSAFKLCACAMVHWKHIKLTMKSDVMNLIASTRKVGMFDFS